MLMTKRRKIAQNQTQHITILSLLFSRQLVKPTTFDHIKNFILFFFLQIVLIKIKIKIFTHFLSWDTFPEIPSQLIFGHPTRNSFLPISLFLSCY